MGGIFFNRIPIFNRMSFSIRNKLPLKKLPLKQITTKTDQSPLYLDESVQEHLQINLQ